MPMLARSAIRGCEASEVKGEPNIMRADTYRFGGCDFQGHLHDAGLTSALLTCSRLPGEPVKALPRSSRMHASRPDRVDVQVSIIARIPLSSPPHPRSLVRVLFVFAALLLLQSGRAGGVPCWGV